MEAKWDWPQISYDWLPEVLCYLKEEGGSWEAFEQATQLASVPTALTRELVRQIKSVLVGLGCISYERKWVKVRQPCTTKEGLACHVTNFFLRSSDEVALVTEVFKEQPVFFNDLPARVEEAFPELRRMHVFKQWARLLQFVGAGYYVEPEAWLPEGSRNVCRVSIHRLTKAICDPRALTGTISKHPAADSLVWSRGEDLLPWTSDVTIVPRLRLELIPDAQAPGEIPEKVPLRLTIGGCVEDFCSALQEVVARVLGGNSFLDYVASAKLLLDFFFFGREMFEKTSLTSAEAESAADAWARYSLAMSKMVEKRIRNAYADVSNLFLGATTFSGAIKRPALELTVFLSFKRIEMPNNKEFPVRAKKSKRTIQCIHTCLQAVEALVNKAGKFKEIANAAEEVERNSAVLQSLVPKSDPLASKSMVSQLRGAIEVTADEERALLAIAESGYCAPFGPEQQALKIPYVVHMAHRQSRDKVLGAVLRVHRKLEAKVGYLKRQAQEVSQEGESRWERACRESGILERGYENHL